MLIKMKNVGSVLAVLGSLIGFWLCLCTKGSKRWCKLHFIYIYVTGTLFSFISVMFWGT